MGKRDFENYGTKDLAFGQYPPIKRQTLSGRKRAALARVMGLLRYKSEDWIERLEAELIEMNQQD